MDKKSDPTNELTFQVSWNKYFDSRIERASNGSRVILGKSLNP